MILDSAEASPSLGFVQQSVRELRYLLYDGHVDSRRWRVLERVALALDGGALEIALIGASHLLRVRSVGSELTEVLACSATVLGADLRVDHPAQSAWRSTASCGVLQFETRGSLRRYTTGEAVARAGAAILARRPQLSQLYPRGHLDTGPLTAIEYTIRSGAARLRTFHTYPEDRTIVVTNTIVGRHAET